MSQVIDQILLEVCLDSRVSDGIFKLEEDLHMEALRDVFMKNGGLTLEDAISISNRMLEGRFPERQAYNKDGILVTFPTPKHKAKALAKGTHFEKNPNPQSEPSKDKPAPTPDEPSGAPVFPPSAPTPAPAPPEEPKTVKQGDQVLAVEPAAPAPSETPPMPPKSPPTQPSTPERSAAEREVVRQMIQTDDSAIMSQQHPSIS